MGFTLITGGSGFLGTYLTRKLVETGRKVIILDITETHSLLFDSLRQIRCIRSDLTNAEDLSRIFSTYPISDVYHVAARVGPQAEENLLETFHNNVQGTINLLEASRTSGVGKFFFGSSTGVYGSGIVPGEPVGEDAPQMPWHMYGSTKVCCELLGERYHGRYGLDFRGLRYPPIFGLERQSKGLSGFCDSVIRESLMGRPYTIDMEPDTLVQGTITVQDAADAAVALMEADESRLTRRIYNIGVISFTAAELTETVKKYIPDAKISFSNNKANSENLKRWPKMDSTRAQSDWGWEAKYRTTDEYVKSVINEYKRKKEKGIEND